MHYKDISKMATYHIKQKYLQTLSRSRTANRNSYSKSDSIIETDIQNIWDKIVKRSSNPLGSWGCLSDWVLRDRERLLASFGSTSPLRWRKACDSEQKQEHNTVVNPVSTDLDNANPLVNTHSSIWIWQHLIGIFRLSQCGLSVNMAVYFHIPWSFS